MTEKFSGEIGEPEDQETRKLEKDLRDLDAAVFVASGGRLPEKPRDEVEEEEEESEEPESDGQELKQ